jgi:hypothetical protein
MTQPEPGIQPKRLDECIGDLAPVEAGILPVNATQMASSDGARFSGD